MNMAQRINVVRNNAFSKHPELNVFASMTTAKEVGGDFYDFFEIDDSHICFVIADVSGKGVPAALFMMVQPERVLSFCHGSFPCPLQ